ISAWDVLPGRIRKIDGFPQLTPPAWVCQVLSFPEYRSWGKLSTCRPSWGQVDNLPKNGKPGGNDRPAVPAELLLRLGSWFDGNGDRIRRIHVAQVGAATFAGVAFARVIARHLTRAVDSERVRPGFGVRRERQLDFPLRGLLA